MMMIGILEIRAAGRIHKNPSNRDQMNTSTLSLYLFVAAGCLVFLLLWAAGVAAVAWATGHRGLHGPERWLWLALPVILPVGGAILYALIRLIARLTPPPGAAEEPRRVTQSMPALDGAGLRGTIPAAEARAAAPPPTLPEPPGQVAPVWRVAVIEGPDQGAAFDLPTFPALIGRSAASAICLGGDLNVSRQHAEIYTTPTALRVRDLGSRQGTRLNGAPIQDQAVQRGDRIQVGASVLLVEGLPRASHGG
jgi:hypothetical protein